MKFERTERRVHFSRVEGIAAVAQMLDQVAKGNSLGNFERALHFVHSVNAADALGIRN